MRFIKIFFNFILTEGVIYIRHLQAKEYQRTTSFSKKASRPKTSLVSKKHLCFYLVWDVFVWDFFAWNIFIWNIFLGFILIDVNNSSHGTCFDKIQNYLYGGWTMRNLILLFYHFNGARELYERIEWILTFYVVWTSVQQLDNWASCF